MNSADRLRRSILERSTRQPPLLSRLGAIALAIVLSCSSLQARAVRAENRQAGRPPTAAFMPPAGVSQQLPAFSAPAWPMLGHDASHSGRSRAAGPDDASILPAPWPYVTGGPVVTSPAIDGSGTAYIGSDDGALHAVTTNGATQFHFGTGGAVRSSAALVPDGPPPTEGRPWPPPVIYFGADDAFLRSVAPNGKLRWELRPGAQPNTSPIRSAPVVGSVPGGPGRRIFVGASNGVLYAVDETSPASAATAWETPTGVPLTTSPALSPRHTIVYAAAPNGMLYCVDTLTGAALPNTPVNLREPELTTPVIDTTGNVYVGGARGNLYSLTEDCQLRAGWPVAIGTPLRAAVALGAHREVLVAAGNVLRALDAGGSSLWDEKLPNPISTAAPIVDGGGTAYVASEDGWVFAITSLPNPSGARLLWSILVDAKVNPALSTPAMDSLGRIYTAGTDGKLYVIDDVPAFQLAYHADQAAPPNLDIYSLRESYGVVDPARNRRLGDDPARERQPAYSLDRGMMAFVSDRDGTDDVFLANGIGGDEVNLTLPGPTVPFAPASSEVDPAFSALDDVTGASRLPNGRYYVALTTNASSFNRLVFLDLDVQAAGGARVLSFGDWATAQGVDPAIVAQLEPPNSEQGQLVFAPDGRKVAWVHCDLARRIGTVLVLVRQGTGWVLQPVGPPVGIEGRGACFDFAPAFAPDSRWLAIHESTLPVNRLGIYDVLGTSAPVYSTPDPAMGHATHPNWAPDGSEIAFGGKTPAAVDLRVASGTQYSTFQSLTASGTSDEPFYHFLKMPPPAGGKLRPASRFTGQTLEILGRGFDILHPQANTVWFSDTLHTTWLQMPVLRTAVDPHEGLGVLAVQVPALAGSGSIKVKTRFGTTIIPGFHVLPKAVQILQKRSVPGAKVRVFGTGFDLTPATQNIVEFSAATPGQWIAATVVGGVVSGNQEVLTAVVPPGIAESGPIRVRTIFGGAACACSFTRLHPKISIQRTTGLPVDRLCGCSGVQVSFSGSDFPFDPIFGYGTISATLNLLPTPLPVPFRSVAFAPDTADSAKLGPTGFPFAGLPPSYPGGNLTIVASDVNLAAAQAQAPFRTPLTNIPIIFVPGTSGTSLDITAGTPLPLTHSQPSDSHSFPWLCKSCLPYNPLNPLVSPAGPIVHPAATFSYNPAAGKPPLWPGDPFGPRVWAGPEMTSHILGGLFLANQGNHYLDAVAFNSSGAPVHPQIVPGTVFASTLTSPPGLNGTSSWGTDSVYAPLFGFLTTPNATLGWPGRPLCSGGATGTCRNSGGTIVSGSNGLYLFNLDWRQSNLTEQARLNTFVDAVLARSDVKAAGVSKVVLITHSYGGPVARAYYLNPTNKADQKVDQVISFGGGFLGVVEPFDILERGSTWGHGLGLGALAGGFAEWETKRLAQNWPTAYFQLPNSEKWFADHGTTVNNNKINRTYVRDLRPVVGKGEITSYAGSMAWIAGRHNSLMATRQRNFFSVGGFAADLGDFRPGTGAIYHHRIMSAGRMDTIAATSVTLGPSLSLLVPPTFLGATNLVAEAVPTEHVWTVYSDGDSTIPYHGALGLTDPSDDRVYILDGIKHTDLTNVPEVLGGKGSPAIKGLLQLLLEGTACSEPQAPLWVNSPGQLPENFGWSIVKPSVPAMAPSIAAADAPPTADRWLLEVRGPANVAVRDSEGHRAGFGGDPNYPDAVVTTIPGATFTPGQVSSVVFLPRAGVYEFTFTGKMTATMDISLSPFNAEGKFDTFFYRDVPMTLRSHAAIVYNTSEQAVVPVLRLDLDGDGRIQTIEPAIVSPEASADDTPPTTMMSVDNGLVTLTANDNTGGAGVLRTYYTTDGVTRRLYTRPFAIPTAARIVMGYSEDQAGNLEYPGVARPVFGLSASSVIFRATAGQTSVPPKSIRVRNLDPIPVTGPLQWQAETSASWLTLSPLSGTTPGTLTLTANPPGLAPGVYNADVVVRALTSGTIFPSRLLRVRLEIQ